MLIHCLSIYFDNFTHESLVRIAGSGDGAGYLIVLVRPTTLDNNVARAYCGCSRWGIFGCVCSLLSYLFSFSLSLGKDPLKTEIPRAV